MQVYSDFNFYKLFSMLMIGCAVIITLAVIVSLIILFILGSIDTFEQFKKYAFKKEN